MVELSTRSNDSGNLADVAYKIKAQRSRLSHFTGVAKKEIKIKQKHERAESVPLF